MFNKFLQDDYNRFIVLTVKDSRTPEEDIEIRELLKKLDKAELLKTARECEVVSIMYPVIREYLSDQEWEKDYMEVKEQLTFMIQNTQSLSEQLTKHGISLIALKNAGIAMAFMDDYGKCPMGDIDTLVQKKDFKKAHQIAVKHGFQFKFRSDFEEEDLETAFADGSTEYLYEGEKRSMWLEIAWRAVAGRWINRKCEPKAEDLFENAVYLEKQGIYILSPEDNLLQVSIHTAKHSYVRKPGFRLHLDVERIAANCPIDWDLFLKKASQAHTKTAVYFSLKCAADLFGTPVPEYVFHALKPSRLKERFIKGVIERCLTLHTPGKKMGRLRFLVFQTCLYDNMGEVFAVAFPGKQQLRQKYPGSGKMSAQLKYLLDLVGIRKEKKDQNGGI